MLRWKKIKKKSLSCHHLVIQYLLGKLPPKKKTPPVELRVVVLEVGQLWSAFSPFPHLQKTNGFVWNSTFEVEKGRFHKWTAVSYCAKKSCNLVIFVTFVLFGLLLVVSSCVVFIGNCLWMPNLTWKSVTLVQVGTSKMLTFGNLASGVLSISVWDSSIPLLVRYYVDLVCIYTVLYVYICMAYNVYIYIYMYISIGFMYIYFLSIQNVSSWMFLVKISTGLF